MWHTSISHNNIICQHDFDRNFAIGLGDHSISPFVELMIRLILPVLLQQDYLQDSSLVEFFPKLFFLKTTITLNGFFFLSLSTFFLYWERLSCSLKLIHGLHWCAIYKCIVLISICPENCMLVSVTTYNAGSIRVPCTHNH